MTNPFLAGVDSELIDQHGYIKVDLLGGEALEEARERTARAQPFGDLEEIKARLPVQWWHHLCCWHNVRSRWGPGFIVKDKWGCLDPERPGEAFDTPAEADTRAKELNSSENFCIREPRPKEDS